MKACFDTMFRRGGAIPFLLLLIVQPCLGGFPVPYVKTDCFTLSEPVSLSNLISNQGKGDYVPGDHIWAWCRLEAGVRKNNLGFSVFQRYDYNGKFSEDTAEIVGLTVNKQDLPTGREFDISFSGTAFHSRGFRFSYHSDPFSWLSLNAGVSYLYADMLIEGGLKGNATVLSDKDYDYAADVNYQYTEDVLFDRQVSPAEGHGYSLDILARFLPAPSWTVDLEFTDLTGRIYWKDLPYTDALATSDRKEYDEDGYVHIDPVLTGYEGYHQRYTQRLSPRSRMGIAYAPHDHAFLVEGYDQYGETAWAIGHRFKMDSLTTLIKFWPQTHAVTLGFSKQTIAFEFSVDHVDIDKIRLFTLSFSINPGSTL